MNNKIKIGVSRLRLSLIDLHTALLTIFRVFTTNIFVLTFFEGENKLPLTFLWVSIATLVGTMYLHVYAYGRSGQTVAAIH